MRPLFFGLLLLITGCAGSESVACPAFFVVGQSETAVYSQQVIQLVELKGHCPTRADDQTTLVTLSAKLISRHPRHFALEPTLASSNPRLGLVFTIVESLEPLKQDQDLVILDQGFVDLETLRSSLVMPDPQTVSTQTIRINLDADLLQSALKKWPPTILVGLTTDFDRREKP